jgi:hypothetical protein
MGERSQLPLNLVLLKNIAVTGIHWGIYESEIEHVIHSMSCDHR